MPPSEPVSFNDRDFQPKPSKRDVALARNTIALCDADADWSDAETHISTALAQTRREALEQAALVAEAKYPRPAKYPSMGWTALSIAAAIRALKDKED